MNLYMFNGVYTSVLICTFTHMLTNVFTCMVTIRFTSLFNRMITSMYTERTYKANICNLGSLGNMYVHLYDYNKVYMHTYMYVYKQKSPVALNLNSFKPSQFYIFVCDHIYKHDTYKETFLFKRSYE